MKKYLLIIIGVLSFIVFCFSRCKEVKMTCKVLSHSSAISPGDNNMHYLSVVECEDDYIRSIEGLQYYAQPVNSNIIYSSYQIK